jgi:RNA polymerase-interacting CarD/CdnL/TRCF family regulator
MIPVERVEDVGLREPIRDTTLIRQVMDSTPEKLDDDARTRQLGIEEKISSGNIQLLAQALRDLCWRETVMQLSPTDRKLKQNAVAKIVEELTLDPLLLTATAKTNIETIIEESMQMHLATTQTH